MKKKFELFVWNVDIMILVGWIYGNFLYYVWIGF